jgi:uncharacterized membrane protein YbaN (DUF454 family)
MKKIKRILLTACGTACVALGVAGIFLPVLPTTPFLLLAAFCYARSSKPFYEWLVTNRWCGTYISNYREGRGITRRHKTYTLLLLWLTIGSTAVLAMPQWHGRMFLLGIAAAVTIHVLKIKTFRTGTPNPPAQAGCESQAERSMNHETSCKGKALA